MEELKLEDLTFESDDKVFDAFATPEGDKPENEDIVIPVPEIKKDIITPTSEDPKDSESVAKGNENNQGQADEAKDKSEANSSSPKLNDSEKLYSTLATHLITKGALSDLDPETIKNVDDLNAAIEKEATSRLDSRQKAISEAMSVGAPTNEVATSIDTITRLESVTDLQISSDDAVELRINLIAQDFLNKGYSSERASTMAKRSIDAGTGVEDAKFALEGIIKSEKAKYEGLIEKAKSDEEGALAKIKDYLQSDKSEVAKIKLTTAQQEEIYTQMTTDVGNKQSEFIKYQQENPVQSRVQLETLYYLTKKFTDFSVFGESAKTEVSNDLEALLRGTNFTEEGRVQTNVADSNSSFTLSDFKDLDIDL